MTDAIIDGTNINTSLFSYSAPKAHASGGKVVNLYNKNVRESLTISTPLILTWGAQEGKDTQGNLTGKWTMSLQFPNSEYSNADAEAFLKSIRALEAKVKADAMTYSKEWFGKTITSPEVMDEKFNVMLRHPKKEKGSAEMDLSKPPTLTVKIPCWSGVWQSEIYDENMEPLFIKGKSTADVSPLKFLTPKTHVICLLQCGGLWFVNGKVSITWNLKQAIVQKPKTSAIAEGTCFLRIKPADKEKLRSLPPPEDDVDPDGAVSSTIVEDSDDDEREVPSTPKPAPAPTASLTPVVEKVVEKVVEAAPVATEEKKKRVITKKKE
jgi:hypothetical protein